MRSLGPQRHSPTSRPLQMSWSKQARESGENNLNTSHLSESENVVSSSLVWGPLKLVVLVLQKRGQGFSELAEKLNQLVDALPRYTLYAQHFKSSSILQSVLGNLYNNYIDFCLRATRYFDHDDLCMFRSPSRCILLHARHSINPKTSLSLEDDVSFL